MWDIITVERKKGEIERGGGGKRQGRKTEKKEGREEERGREGEGGREREKRGREGDRQRAEGGAWHMESFQTSNVHGKLLQIFPP